MAQVDLNIAQPCSCCKCSVDPNQYAERKCEAELLCGQTAGELVPGESMLDLSRRGPVGKAGE
eukprot:6214371-Pleurochrysis_carterae.AAC.4